MKDAFSGYRMTERRALLQAIRANETLIDDMYEMKSAIESADISKLINSIVIYADSQRKAFLQIVRDTEKAYRVTRSKTRSRHADKIITIRKKSKNKTDT